MKNLTTSPVFITLFCLLPALLSGQKDKFPIEEVDNEVIEHQLIVEYGSWEYAMQDYDSMKIAGGTLIDGCGCDRPIYLWQFENLDQLIEIDTKVQGEKSKADVDSDGNQRIGIAPIKASRTWRIEYESSNDYSTNVDVHVYILDTGLSMGWNNARSYAYGEAPVDECYPIEPSIGYNYVTNSREVINTNFNDMHSPGHGTIGFRAIAEGLPNQIIKIIPIKVFDENGNGNLFDLICAIYHGIDNGADIINISAGFSGESSDILEKAIGVANKKNVFIVTAVGNDTTNIDFCPQYPAVYAKDYENVISVASINSDEELSHFSNYGRQSTTMVAYGEDICVYSKDEELIGSSGSSISTFYVTKELAAEIARTPNRDYRTIWTDFKKSKIVECPGMGRYTKTGMRLDVEINSCRDESEPEIKLEPVGKWWWRFLKKNKDI